MPKLYILLVATLIIGCTRDGTIALAKTSATTDMKTERSSPASESLGGQPSSAVPPSDQAPITPAGAGISRPDE